VTTSAVSGRTVVFVEGGRSGRGRRLPELDLKKGIQYVAPLDGIGVDHVLASAAIPILFPPVEVATSPETTDWFVDGGLRLNTPIKPAIKLDVARVAIVAADPARHAESSPSAPQTTPDFDDLLLHILQATLADPLIEDMWRLAGVNTLLEDRQKTDGKRPIEYLFVGPETRGQLGERAGKVVKRLGLSEFRLFDWILGRQGAQHHELLSYLLFHPEFFEQAAELGQADARAELDHLENEGIDWRTAPMS
jgi:NTE family protein